FSLFYGGTNAAILLIQLAASSRVLATRALRRTLAIEPVAMLAAAGLWALWPVVLNATLARGGEAALKFAIARPAQEIAVTPLSSAARQRWKVLLRGGFQQAGSLGAGLLLLALGPVLAANPAAVPGIAAALAAAVLVAQRRVATAY